MHLAARHPDRVRSLSLHSAWDMSDRYLNTVVELWRSVATTRPTVADAVVDAVFPLCFTPDMYVNRPDLADTLAELVRSRPAQPLCAFLAQTEAAMTHDASGVLGEIAAPSQITVGALDLVCSPRFAERIGDSELVVFERLSHGGLHEDAETFNRATLDFLRRRRSSTGPERLAAGDLFAASGQRRS